MSPQNNESDPTKMNPIVAEARRNQQKREKGYREKAFKLFPKVCGRCGREFEGKRLRELTVHHRDHNHDNNPPDGSNWELLCIYCHENEHSRYGDQEYFGETGADETPDSQEGLDSPFAGLADLLNKKA